MKNDVRVLDGKLTISRVHGNENYIEIRLTDAKSHLIVADIKVSPETFGEVVTGLSYQDVKYDHFINDPNKFGKSLETKKELIEIEYSYYDDNEAKRQLIPRVKEFEIDGWEADIDGSFGLQSTYAHNDGKNYVNVLFRRWI